MENKVLDIKWDKFEDILIFCFNEICQRFFDVLPTKRDFIKTIASIYDRLRFLNRIVV